MAVKAGELNKRISLQAVTQTETATGGISESWSTFISVWAQVKPTSSREFMQASQAREKVSHRIKIRYRSDVTVKHRVRYGSRTLKIVSVINTDESDEELILMCEEIIQ